MARIESFRELETWQKAMVLAELCYQCTESFPRAERFGLAVQIRRSAVSIASNVAEGHNRRSRLAYRNHIAIALGSLAELETQIELGQRLKFVEPEILSRLQNISGQVGRLLHGLVRALERNAAT